MNREFKDALEDSPVIAAIKDEYGRLQSDNRDHDDRAAGLCFV